MCKPHVLVAILWFALCPNAPKAAETNVLPKVVLAQVQHATMAQMRHSSPDEARIKQLIRSLAQVDHPDWGFSTTLSGTAFSPIAGFDRLEGTILTPANLETSSNLVELVRLGPSALPFLLEALEDATPTKLVLKLSEHSGGMWFDIELRGNPAVSVERRVIESRLRMDAVAGFEPPQDIDSYRMTVGDLCFVIIGQIVNRPYQAARYQMTACTVVNSPTHDLVLAKEVREIWDAPDLFQRLLDSLLVDFATESVIYPAGRRDPSRWLDASNLRPGAALRLLYYYPQETTNFLAARLRTVDPEKLGCPLFGNFDAALVKAASWSTEPVIEAQLRRIFQGTTNSAILALTAEAMRRADGPGCRRRLEFFLDRLQPTEKGPFGEGAELLSALGKGFGVEAKPCFERYINSTNLPSRECMCDVLGTLHAKWSLGVLAPLLGDTNLDNRYERPLFPDRREPAVPMRICDEAGAIISHDFPKLKFEMTGPDEHLDQQLQVMRYKIALHDY